MQHRDKLPPEVAAIRRRAAAAARQRRHRRKHPEKTAAPVDPEYAKAWYQKNATRLAMRSAERRAKFLLKDLSPSTFGVLSILTVVNGRCIYRDKHGNLHSDDERSAEQVLADWKAEHPEEA